MEFHKFPNTSKGILFYSILQSVAESLDAPQGDLLPGSYAAAGSDSLASSQSYVVSPLAHVNCIRWSHASAGGPLLLGNSFTKWAEKKEQIRRSVPVANV